MWALAKLWSQLSLQASRIRPPFSPNSASSHFFEIAFALTHLDSLDDATTKTPSHFGRVANVRDIKPPAGVSIGHINFIELDLVLAPLSCPVSLPSSKRTTWKVQRRGRRKSQRLLAIHARSNQTPSLRSITETASVNNGKQRRQMEADFSVVSRICNKPDTDFQMLDDGLQILQPVEPISDAISVEPSRTTRATTQEEACSPQNTQVNPLDLLRLIDASIRQTISGTAPVSTTTNRKSSNSRSPEIKLAEANQPLGLADICPALFRPGCMEVHASRLRSLLYATLLVLTVENH